VVNSERRDAPDAAAGGSGQTGPGLPPIANDEVGPWSAFDLAAATGRSIGWAREALARWRTAGLVDQVGSDSITGAPLYDPDQIRTAQQADLDAPGT
jgi:hypothetical protein